MSRADKPLRISVPVFAATLSVMAATASGAFAAAKVQAPVNQSPPTISGTATSGSTLTGSSGSWSANKPTYSYRWRRCDSAGASCVDLSGATTTRYTVQSSDAGSTLRFAVTVTNSAGSATAVSAPTAVVPGASTPPPDPAPAPAPDPSPSPAPDPSPSPAPTPSGSVLFSDGFAAANGSNSLITNEFAHWNPNDGTAVRSADWDMTSGSFFDQSGTGYSGTVDDCAPDRYSQTCTNSAVFRLNTQRADFTDVRVDMKLLVNSLSSTSSTPQVDWDGIHIWLRYQSEYFLYYASVNRRDGSVVIKKKCTGGVSNGGTYYTLASRSGYPIPFGTWQNVGASASNNADGSVTIKLYREGNLLLQTTDAGTGCAPITGAGAVGVRGDNANFNIDDFTVSSLP